jgi:hypothetical protein
MSGKRQKNQLVLAFTAESRSEAPRAAEEGTETLVAKDKYVVEGMDGCTSENKFPIRNTKR